MKWVVDEIKTIKLCTCGMSSKFIGGGMGIFKSFTPFLFFFLSCTSKADSSTIWFNATVQYPTEIQRKSWICIVTATKLERTAHLASLAVLSMVEGEWKFKIIHVIRKIKSRIIKSRYYHNLCITCFFGPKEWTSSRNTHVRLK